MDAGGSSAPASLFSTKTTVAAKPTANAAHVGSLVLFSPRSTYPATIVSKVDELFIIDTVVSLYNLIK